MPGFNQAQLSYKVQNGNSVVVLVGDTAIAFAQTVNHSFDLGAEPFYGVGSAKPQENQQLRVGPSISLDHFTLTTAGQNLLTGGVNLSTILANNQFTICIADGVNNIALFTYIGCVAGRVSNSIGANRPITETIDFIALDVLNQSGQSILDGPNALNINANVGIAVNGGLGLSVAATATF